MKKLNMLMAESVTFSEVFYRHYPSYKNKQLNVSELARVCDMSRTIVYKYIEVLEG